MDLAELRKRIDEIDANLLKLLNERMEQVKAIGVLKSHNGVIYRPEREKAIIERLKELNKGPLTAAAIEAIFYEIFAISRNIELPEKVAYLGPQGSFSHQAAESRFGAVGEYVGLPTIRSVFESVVTNRCRFGVVPIENNQEGIVNETIQLLSTLDTKIVAEIPMPIHFAFATLSENVGDIRKIYSKDIAFKQCQNFIHHYFNAEDIELVPVDSTSKAVKIAMEEDNSAALCSHIAARLYKLPILFENVEDSQDNYTRFLVLASDIENEIGDSDKTTILVRLHDDTEPGSLARFLQEFHQAGINLTKIESYPAKEGKSFTYWFYLEFEGHYKSEYIKVVMDRHKKSIRWLGSYARLC